MARMWTMDLPFETWRAIIDWVRIRDAAFAIIRHEYLWHIIRGADFAGLVPQNRQRHFSS
jgi:hypothetical protein